LTRNRFQDRIEPLLTHPRSKGAKQAAAITYAGLRSDPGLKYENSKCAGRVANARQPEDRFLLFSSSQGVDEKRFPTPLQRKPNSFSTKKRNEHHHPSELRRPQMETSISCAGSIGFACLGT